MEKFVKDDQGYLQWLGTHPRGYVLNALPSVGAKYLVLHRATCWTINGIPTNGKRFTHTYTKLCFVLRADFEAWEKQQDVVGQWAPCRICNPDIASTSQVLSRAGSTDGQPTPTKPTTFSSVRPASSKGQAVLSNQPWQLWTQGTVLARLDGIMPRLAVFEKKTHPAMIKMQEYLDAIASRFGPLLADRTDLFVHMEIDVEKEERLLHHYDLENYLSPVALHLGAGHLKFASAIKRVGGGSCLVLGEAIPWLNGTELATQGWEAFAYHAGPGLASPSGKAALRAALQQAGAQLLPDGPVEVHLAWRCLPYPKRNWGNLWKSTGDTMGPALGEPYPHLPFYPNDDRIVSLQLHFNPDATMGHHVDVGMWWRPQLAVAGGKSPSR